MVDPSTAEIELVEGDDEVALAVDCAGTESSPLRLQSASRTAGKQRRREKLATEKSDCTGQAVP
eukprot:2729496-Amphidinium_carterae.1